MLAVQIETRQKHELPIAHQAVRKHWAVNIRTLLKRNLIAAALFGLASAQAGVAFAEPTLGHIDHALVSSPAKVAAASRAPEQFIGTRKVSDEAQERLYSFNP